MELTEPQRRSLLGLVGAYNVAAATKDDELPLTFVDILSDEEHSITDLLTLLMDGTPNRLSVEISPVDRTLLATLSDTGEVKEVVARLIDHAAQGVYRPGAWERQWLEQAFGTEFLAKLEPGCPYGRPNRERIFQKPKKP